MTLSAQDLEALARYAYRRWGLVLSERKEVMLHNRMLALRRKLAFDDVASLVAGLERAPAPEIDLALFDALSTNHTGFFRESAHFDVLRGELFPDRPGPGRDCSAARGGVRLRVWSAGCSTGCEPYSISIVAHEALGDPSRHDVRILATDLSQTVLAAAREGVYARDSLGALSDELTARYFERAEAGGRSWFRVRRTVRSLVSFGLLNLLEPWSMRGPFDAILCRNVMIYFDPEVRLRLARRFAALLRPGGLFFVGTSETLRAGELGLDPVAHGVYRRPPVGAARRA